MGKWRRWRRRSPAAAATPTAAAAPTAAAENPLAPVTGRKRAPQTSRSPILPNPPATNIHTDRGGRGKRQKTKVVVGVKGVDAVEDSGLLGTLKSWRRLRSNLYIGDARPQTDVSRINYEADKSMRKRSNLPPPLDIGGPTKYKFWVSSSLAKSGDNMGTLRQSVEQFVASKAIKVVREGAEEQHLGRR